MISAISVLLTPNDFNFAIYGYNFSLNPSGVLIAVKIAVASFEDSYSKISFNFASLGSEIEPSFSISW